MGSNTVWMSRYRCESVGAVEVVGAGDGDIVGNGVVSRAVGNVVGNDVGGGVVTGLGVPFLDTISATTTATTITKPKLAITIIHFNVLVERPSPSSL